MSAGTRMGQAYRSWKKRLIFKGKPVPRGRVRKMIRAGMREEIRNKRLSANKGAAATKSPAMDRRIFA